MLLILAFLFASMMAADENINSEKIRAAHIIAMKYYGHATLLEEKNIQMAFSPMAKGLASFCYGKELATAYLEAGDVKYYWYVEKTQKGILLSHKANRNGVKYSRTVEVTISDAEISIRQRQDLDEGERISCDWGCIGGKFFKCIHCAIDWKCWLTCAGPAIWECCKFDK